MLLRDPLVFLTHAHSFVKFLKGLNCEKSPNKSSYFKEREENVKWKGNRSVVGEAQRQLKCHF